MPFQFESLPLADARLIIPKVFEDARGHFFESFKESDFAAVGIHGPFRQENQSRSVRHVLRGLHFQRPPYAQAKLIRVLRGWIYDVFVDLRPASPTFAQWAGITLSSDSPRLLYVPEGFAHGFLVLSDEADVLYRTTAEYHPEAEAGIRWDDPDLAIAWPVAQPLLSPRDAQLPSFRDIRASLV